MAVDHENIKSYEKGREYSREIYDQIQTVNNGIDCVQSRGCPELEHLDNIAPGTTPSRKDILNLKREADWCVEHMYEHHVEERRITKHFLKLQQLCIDCLENVYEE